MKKYVAAVASLLITGSVFASGNVSLSGIVVDLTSNPVAGASVILQNQPSLTTVTAADGSFVLSTTAIAAFGRNHAPATGSIQLTGSNLTFPRGVQGDCTIELFTCAGKQLFAVTITDLATGTRQIKLPDFADGMYVLKATAGSVSSTFKQQFVAGMQLSIGEAGKTVTGEVQLAKALQASDSLVAIAPGFAPAYLGITTPTGTNLQIKFTNTVNQWQPTAALEKSTSLVKIMAKGHSFAVGQPSNALDESGADISFEQPVNVVSFTYDYWMDTTEITQKMFDSLMAQVPGYQKSTGWTSTYGVGDNIAAHHISGSDAMLFCNARSKKENLDTCYSYTGITGNPGRQALLAGVKIDVTKNGYRLPTQEEFEYACRGGTVTDFFWGKNAAGNYPKNAADSAEISMYCIWDANSGNFPNDKPEYAVKRGVAKTKPNKYGLYDMIGSLTEWYHITTFAYASATRIDPKPDATVLPDDQINGNVPLRGGHFASKVSKLRSASRIDYGTFASYPYCYWGFRTVREVK